MSKWPLVSGQTGVWYKVQSDFNTTASISTASSWTKMVCEHSYSLADNTIDLDDSVGQSGAAGDQVPGSQDGGTLTLKGFVRGQAEAYDGTGAIGQSPELALITEFLGGAVLRNYQAAAVGTGSGAQTVVISSGTFGDGELAAFGASSLTVDSMGFISNQGGLDFREDSASEPGNGDNAYGTVTGYTSSAQFVAKTIRILGGTTTRELLFTGWVPSKCTLTWATGTVLQFELEGTFTAHEWGSNGDDVEAAPTYQSLPAFLGDNGGRFTVNGAANANDSVGTDDVYCGAMSQSVTITREQFRVSCPSAAQGVSEVILGDPMVTMSFEVPIDSDEVATGTTVWDDRYSDRTKFSIAAYVGNRAGRIFAMCIPAARVSKRPDLKMVGGKLVGHSIEVQPGPYDGDNTSGGAASAAFSIATA